MFTGLIQDIGIVKAVTKADKSALIEVETKLAPTLKEGDSLAINGVCLTVGAPQGNLVRATAVFETLERTVLGTLDRGSFVNLEPALAAGDPLGGHIVSGHVDGLGRVKRIERVGVSQQMKVSAAPDILRYVVEKGSIAINGISLTIAAIDPSSFTVAVIPHTWEATTLKNCQIGDELNLEVDILAKYVEKMLDPLASGKKGLTEAKLRDLGY